MPESKGVLPTYSVSDIQQVNEPMAAAYFALGGWMQNNWCSSIVINFTTIYFIILIFVSPTLYCILLFTHIRIRKSTHPAFSVLFTTIILAYIICAVCGGIQKILHLMGEESNIIEKIVVMSYNYISPCFLCCLLERILATILHSQYEHLHSWTLLFIAILSALFLSYCQTFLLNTSGDIGEYFPLLISVVIILLLITLLSINYQMIKRVRQNNNGSLTSRFQLVENFRVLRYAMLPVILCDTVISTMDYLGGVFFNSYGLSEREKCDSSKIFLYIFLTMNTLSLFLEYSIPIIILLKWDIYKKNFPCTFLWRKQINPSPNKQITNVFGEELNCSNHTSSYFDQLKSQWDK